MSFELGQQNLRQTIQLNPLFHTFADLVNRVVAWQTTDWLVPNSQFSPNVYFILPTLNIISFGFFTIGKSVRSDRNKMQFLGIITI